MDRIVEKYSPKATFPYLDNITVCGYDQADHDTNLQKFMQAAAEVNLTFNKSKCEFSTRRLKILGSVIENGTLKPDPERMKPLRDIPPPSNMKSLKRILGFFSYYSQWIKQFSDKIRPLSQTNSFPITQQALQAFLNLKKEIEESVVTAINETIPFEVETDASDVALGATLNQGGRPVAFFSRTLHGAETTNSAIEKEAQACVEAIRYWRDFLLSVI